MSLINEALKRAEVDKVRNASPYFDNLTVLTPGEDDVPPPPRPVTDPPPRRRVSPMGLLGGALVLVGLAGTGLVWYRWPVDGPPKRAAAAQPPEAPAGTSRPETFSATPAPVPERPGPATRDAQVRQAFAKTMAKLQALDATVDLPAEPGQAPAPTSRPVAAMPAPARGPTTKPAPAPTSAPAQAAKPTSAPSEPPKPTPAPRPKPTPRPVDASRFRLNAIVRGPDGNAALINGNLLHEGQTVLGATIVKIGRYHVELDLSGRRFTIRM